MINDTEDGPVEVTTRYATRVDELSEAWTFIMDRVDKVGEDPHIHITPVWIIEHNEDGTHTEDRIFEVVVEGMVPEAKD